MKVEDEIEELISSLDQNSNMETLHLLFRKICLSLKLNDSSPQTSLLEQNNSSTIKKTVVSFLLRILNVQSNLLWLDSGLRHKVINLFNEVLSPQIYKIVGLEDKNNSHDIFAKLQTIHSDIIAEFERIVSAIVSIETAISIKQSYLKLLKNPKADIFIKHQVYDQSLVAKERIIEFFNKLENYSQADRIDSIDAFSSLEVVYNNFIVDINSHGKNIYVKSFIEKILSASYQMAKLSFKNSNVQITGELSLKALERKYPLHILNTPFHVKLAIVNSGPGIAFDTNIIILDSDKEIKIVTQEVNMGTIDVGRHEIIIMVSSLSFSPHPPVLIGILSWGNYKNERTEIDFEISIIPQNGTLDWDRIKYEQPYSLESVDSESELVGRKDLLENISSKLSLRKGESSIIYGQKRVGKTSLARIVQNRFKQKDGFLTLFIETGSLDKSSPAQFIKSLGEKIIRQLKKSFPRIGDNNITFISSLYPLVSYVEEVIESDKNVRIILVFDEFDEIPPQLYPYTEDGNSFFHNLRSLSGESGDGRVALILVGGENMNVIMQSTDKLNKFDAWNVGYFNKSEYWDDFKELLTMPVHEIIEYSDESLLKLYEFTEGNPFYTKFVAKTLYKKMCEKRCSFISVDEMEDAINDTILHLEAINLNHFWSDGIRVEDPERRDLIETQRRRFLIAFAEKLRNEKKPTKKELIDDLSLSAIPCKEILESFISRNIVVEEFGYLRIKPKLFEVWLIEKGVHTLRASFSDEDAQKAFNDKDEKAYVSSAEIIELSESWELYRGSKIGSEDIRSWLDQFENNLERRLAFKLLKNINFYGETKIREKLKIIHNSIKKEIIHSMNTGERVRKDILISSFGQLTKSGPSYLRIYAAENSITSHSVKSYHELGKSIEADENIKAIVFIDDIIASGESMLGHINKLNEDIGIILENRNILIVIGIICGMSSGVDNCISGIEKLDINYKIIIKTCDILSNENKCFHEKSSIFDNDHERSKALAMARKYGTRVDSRSPLGYNDGQLLVVLKDNCPNNTLPIFWGGASNPSWRPLFKRN
jgi:AAA+ ATPase superfamily predicted ATPase